MFPAGIPLSEALSLDQSLTTHRPSIFEGYLGSRVTAPPAISIHVSQVGTTFAGMSPPGSQTWTPSGTPLSAPPSTPHAEGVDEEEAEDLLVPESIVAHVYALGSGITNLDDLSEEDKELISGAAQCASGMLTVDAPDGGIFQLAYKTAAVTIRVEKQVPGEPFKPAVLDTYGTYA
jgi:hypothetical protein